MTKQKSHSSLILTSLSFGTLAAALLLSGCSNPADDVSEASVGEAKETKAPAAAEGVAYAISPRSKIEFIGSKVTGSHDGGFAGFWGDLMVVDGVLKPKGSKIEIEMNTIWSDADKLTAKLKTAEYFDTDKYPMVSFLATSIEEAKKPSDRSHTITGNLELHGITRSISFDADIYVSKDMLTIKAEFYIKRFDFGIMSTGQADNMIRDEVVIKLDVIAIPGG